MFKIDNDTKQINLTRGDIATFKITALNDDKTKYQFKENDKVTLSIYEKKNLENLKLTKSVVVTTPGEYVELSLTSEETKIDDLINKPVEYWYELVLNDNQTIIGYDEEGAKIFKLYPEGDE